MAGLSKTMWNFVLRPPKTWCLDYQSGHGQQTKQGCGIQWLPPIMPYDPLSKWYCEITWQTKAIMSPLPYYPWIWNLEGWWLALSGSHSRSYFTLWSSCFCQITWEAKNISLLPQYLYQSNLAGCWDTMRSSHS